MSLLVADIFGFEVTALVRAPGKKAAGSSWLSPPWSGFRPVLIPYNAS